MEGLSVESYLGKVVHVIDPDNFWMQIGTDDNFAAFLQFEINLDEYCNTNTSCIDDISELHPGQHVLVNCNESCGSWRRGQVSRIDSAQKCADVFYIDYGDTELVEEMRICTQLPDFITYPKQGLPCKLAGVKPIAKTWTSRAMKRFEELTKDTVFHTVILPADTSFVFKVMLYQQNGRGSSISFIMMDEELAMPTEDHVTEFFEDVPEFYRENVNQKDQALQNGKESTDEDLVNDDAEDTPMDGIPGFDLSQIHHTKNTNTEKLHAKINRQNRKALEKETEKILQEVNEMKAEAGYDDTESSGSEEDAEMMLLSHQQGQVASNLDVPRIIKPDSSDSPNRQVKGHHRVSTRTDSLSPRRYSKSRARDGTNNRKTGRHDSPEVSGSGSDRSLVWPGVRNSPNRFESESASSEYTRDNTFRNSPVGYKNRHGSGGPRGSSPSTNYMKDRYGSPRNSFSNGNRSSPYRNESPFDRVSRSGGMSPCETSKEFSNSQGKRGSQGQRILDKDDFPDIHKLLQQIFTEYNRENEEVIRVRIKSLFDAELYLYLDREEMEDVINTIMNRAVRHYGDLHDVLLETIETLSCTDDFESSILEAAKKLESMYCKIQTKGSAFHVQCSKVLGHLFNLSLHWQGSEKLRDFVLLTLEKWILFNKKVQQIGQDRLQEIYLECFSTLWVICGDSIHAYFPEQKGRMESECRDKILNADVPRGVRSQLLDIYVGTFRCLSVNKISVPPTPKLPETKVYREAACQTDHIVPSTSGTPEVKPKVVSVPPGFSKRKPNQDINMSETDWPSLSGAKLPEWTAKLLEGQQVLDWPTPDEPSMKLTGMDMLMTPQSFETSASVNSVAYFLPDEYKFRHNTGNSVNSPEKSNESPESNLMNESLKKKSDQSNNMSQITWANRVSKKSDTNSSCNTKHKEMGHSGKKEKNSHGSRGATPLSTNQRTVTSPSQSHKSKSLQDAASEWLSGINHKEGTTSGTQDSSKKTDPSNSEKMISNSHHKINESSKTQNSNANGKSMNKSNIIDWFSMEERPVDNVKSASLPSAKSSHVDKETRNKEKEQVKDSSSEERKVSEDIVSSKSSDHSSKNGAKEKQNNLSIMSALVCYDDEEDDDFDIEWETESSDSDNNAPSTHIKHSAGTDSNQNDVKAPTFNQPKPEATKIHKRDVWNPGKKICTYCGSESHRFFDCPQNKKKGLFY